MILRCFGKDGYSQRLSRSGKTFKHEYVDTHSILSDVVKINESQLSLLAFKRNEYYNRFSSGNMPIKHNWSLRCKKTSVNLGFSPCINHRRKSSQRISATIGYPIVFNAVISKRRIHRIQVGKAVDLYKVITVILLSETASIAINWKCLTLM